jgi:hypothetical protein
MTVAFNKEFTLVSIIRSLAFMQKQRHLYGRGFPLDPTAPPRHIRPNTFRSMTRPEVNHRRSTKAALASTRHHMGRLGAQMLNALHLSPRNDGLRANAEKLP